MKLTNPRHIALFCAIFVGGLALDQWVKAWVRGAMPERGGLGGKPWPGVFELTLTYNQGIAFGMFNGFGKFLSPVAIVIACGAIWYSLKHQEESWPSHVAMGLMASGALGNLIDRVWRSKVTDMFWFRAIDFPVFNVADACITVSVCILVLIWWREAAIEKASRVAKHDVEPPADPV